MTMNINRAWLKRMAGGVAVLALAGCAQPVQVAQAPAGPIPPGQARIWFYRDYEPSVSRNFANIDVNGVRLASVPPAGGPAYRDVAPGHYVIAPESNGVDINQSRQVDLGPGQEAFAKIQTDDSRIAGGDVSEYRRDTFYVWLMAPDLARAQIAANHS
jgi:hypothetical protein